MGEYIKSRYICPYCGKTTSVDGDFVETDYTISNREQTMIQYFHRRCYLENVRKEKAKWAKLSDLK